MPRFNLMSRDSADKHREVKDESSVIDSAFESVVGGASDTIKIFGHAVSNPIVVGGSQVPDK